MGKNLHYFLFKSDLLLSFSLINLVLVENTVKLNGRKNVQQKQRKEDSFINDESLSSDSESMYHTALTNPRTSTNNTTSKLMPVPASIKRYVDIIFIIYIDKYIEFNHYFVGTDCKQYVIPILKMKMINLAI